MIQNFPLPHEPENKWQRRLLKGLGEGVYIYINRHVFPVKPSILIALYQRASFEVWPTSGVWSHHPSRHLDPDQEANLYYKKSQISVNKLGFDVYSVFYLKEAISLNLFYISSFEVAMLAASLYCSYRLERGYTQEATLNALVEELILEK